MEDKKEEINEQGKVNVEELGKVLYEIHCRLISEGYTITKDEIIDPEGKAVY